MLWVEPRVLYIPDKYTSTKLQFQAKNFVLRHFHYVAQPGLNPPALVSQIAVITVVQAVLYNFLIYRISPSIRY